VVKVDVYKISKGNPKKEFTCRGHVVFVAVDADGKPIPVPALKLVTEEDERNWKIGEKIKEISKERRNLHSDVL